MQLIMGANAALVVAFLKAQESTPFSSIIRFASTTVGTWPFNVS